MNSLYIVLIVFILYYLGYRFYANLIVKLWNVNPEEITPAHRFNDGIDYVPAKHWTVLFGHHFASIAGAGPIIGPVIAAALWGWLPALIWLVLGSIFLGGVHDFSALIASLKHEGKSISYVAESTLGYKSKMIFATFLWLSLILVVAVFAAVAGKTLAAKPEIVLPTFGIVVVALIVGLMMYKFKVNQLTATLLGIVLLFILIIAGYYYPIKVKPFHIGSLLISPKNFWITILLIYAYFASIIPVNILLQPRDYLSTFVLFFGLFLGYLGLVVSHPQIQAPAFVTWNSSQGWLWPMLCVIIACGAISGFHSLVASGTTAKQLSSMKDAKRIGYGAMILESVLAVLALLSVVAGLKWSGRGSLVYPQLLAEKGWIITFGEGFGQIVLPFIKVGLGSLIAITILKTFIMTTLDSATRITRYLTEELFVDGLNLRFLKNRYLQTFIIVAFAGWLAYGKYQVIWPVFGAANQLVAALVLIIVTAYLFSQNRPKRYTLIPGIFMLMTTIVALGYLMGSFYRKGLYLLFSIDCLLLVLAFVIAYEVFRYLTKKELLKNV